jgi:hypothetical protein
MLGLAAICWAISKKWNDVCFEKKTLRNPLKILCSACVFMSYWAGLYPEVTKEVFEVEVDLVLHTVIELLGRKKKEMASGTILAIEDKRAPNHEDGDSG